MALRDAACYTLTLIPSLKDPTVIELVENINALGDGQPRYCRLKEEQDGEVYSGAIYDAYSGARLGSMGWSDGRKIRRLQLHGPDEDVSFESTGKLGFEWTFVFEGNKYRWNRELYGKDYVCSLERKPDPKVEICLARDGDRNTPGRLQILHYNIDRFPNEIKDIRGLETLLVATLMSFIDASEERVGTTLKRPDSYGTVGPTSSSKSPSPQPPPVPPKPEKLISEDDYEPENPNELLVGMDSSIDEHVAKAVRLFEDPHVLFIVIRTRTAAATQRALEVSLGVTRFRHREGMGDLHQYVIEEDPVRPCLPKQSTSARTAPVINLDDPIGLEPKARRRSSASRKNVGSTMPGPSWSAPNIAIYLSTIDLPDLKPGRRETFRKPSKEESFKPTSPSLTPSVPARPVTGDTGLGVTHPPEAERRNSSYSLGKLLKAAASKV